MRHGPFNSIALMLTLAGLAPGQSTPADPPAATQTATPAAVVVEDRSRIATECLLRRDIFQPTQDADAFPYLCWIHAEYLTWWVKDGPKPPPLVTAGAITAPNPAMLNAPGTTVLAGNADFDYHTFMGGRLSAGTWCNLQQTIGVEVSGFWLEQRSVKFTAQADPNGQNALGRPFIDAESGQELVDFVTFPNRFAGGVSLTSASRLWGLEANLLGNFLKTVVHSPGGSRALGDIRADWVAGFRYLDLAESLNITDNSILLAEGAAVFLGTSVLAPNSLVTSDAFQTRNRFYGGQVGLRAEFVRNCFFADFVGKLAVGNTHETLDITGSTTLAPLGEFVPVQTARGGLLATSTNIGRTQRDRLSLVPQVGLQAGYEILPNIRVFAGYTALYWTHAIRPADQIDRTVNLTQVPASSTFGPLSGPARPAVPTGFKDGDFWAQGLSWGVEFRY